MKQPVSNIARLALARASGDYVSKDVDELEVVADLKQRHNLDTVYRFDIGKNTDGFSPLIDDVLDTPELVHLMAGTLTEYPENHYQLLRHQLTHKFDLPEDSFVFSAGLETIIDEICRAVLDPGDVALIPTPNFDVFESSTVRSGGVIDALPVNEDSVLWSDETVDRLERYLREKRIKLAWISNPVNPTGQHLPSDYIERLVKATSAADAFIVVDEAYGEYCDKDDGVVSAASLIDTNPHLMVLRTFSKIYCLPSARVGYMACSGKELREAVRTFRPMFPFSWISLYMAQLAILDKDHVNHTRHMAHERKQRLEAIINEPDSGLRDFEFLPSDTNTIMFRHARLSADDLHDRLARQGFLTANLNNVSGIQGQQYLRMTLHKTDINRLFLQACTRADEG